MSQFFASGGQSTGSFSFNISPSNEYSGLVFFRVDWLGLLAAQGTLKSLLQHHSSKASILQCSAFFTVQLSHPYMTTGKTIALTRRTFVGKVMSLLNMLSRLVITFLPRRKRLLISRLQSPSVVILEPPKIKSAASWEPFFPRLLCLPHQSVLSYSWASTFHDAQFSYLFPSEDRDSVCFASWAQGLYRASHWAREWATTPKATS